MGNSNSPSKVGTPASGRSPWTSPSKGGRNGALALASPVGAVSAEKPSITIPLSPPPPSPAISPASSVARSSVSEASSADSFFGDESFFESIQEGWHRRKVEKRRKRLNAVGTTGRPCILKLSTLEISGLDQSQKPFAHTAALRIQLVEATPEGAAKVVWERQSPEIVVGPGILPLFQHAPYFIPHATSRQSLVLSLIINDELWAQARFLMTDVHSTVQRTRLVCRSDNFPEHGLHKDAAHASHSSQSATPKTPAPRTPTRRTPPRHSLPATMLSPPPTPQPPNLGPPAPPERACAVTGGLDFFTHFSAASTWMDVWSDVAREPQRRLVVLANRLYFFTDTNDEHPLSYGLECIDDVNEDEFHHGLRTLVMQLRPPAATEKAAEDAAKEGEKEWVLAPPCDREFLHWFQLLRKKIYETEFGAAASAVATPGTGE